MTDLVEEAITRAHREEWARIVAGLARRFGDLDLAEEAAAVAFLVAVERWSGEGVPPNTGGWLTTTATRKASTAAGDRADRRLGRAGLPTRRRDELDPWAAPSGG